MQNDNLKFKIFDVDDLDKIINILELGEILIFPTETSYGLGCDATNQAAVDKIFKIKGRAGDKPLLVVVPDVEMARKYLVWNELLEDLASKYWPGAVTVVGEYIARVPLSVSPLSGGESDDDGRVPLLVSPLSGGGNDGVPSLCKKGRAGVGFRLATFLRTKSLRQNLRNDQTKAEKILWNGLRDKKLGGLKFRRQHGIGQYIVDFYQSDSKIIVEVDGDIHFSDDATVAKDKTRKLFLEQNGYQILRYNNVDIFNNYCGVLDDIYFFCSERLRVPTLTIPLSREGIVAISPPDKGEMKEGDSRRTPDPTPDPTPALPFLQREGKLANGVVAKDGTVAVRVTANPFLKLLTEKLGRPIVATSANLAGAPEIYDSTEAIKVFENLENKPDAIVAAGILPKNSPSTIVSVVANKIKILRQGRIKII